MDLFLSLDKPKALRIMKELNFVTIMTLYMCGGLKFNHNSQLAEFKIPPRNLENSEDLLLCSF